MSGALQVLVGVGLGAGVVFAFGQAFGGGGRPVPMEAPAVSEAVAPAERAADHGTPDGAAVAAGLDRIEARLAELAAKLASLERKVDAAATAPPARTAVVPAGPAPAAVVDEEAIVRALERVEQRKLDGLSFHDLMGESMRQLKSNDPTSARRALDTLLARQLEPEDRARALTQLAMVHRAQGDVDGSMRVLEGVMREYGLQSRAGSEAAFQLVWTRSKSGDHQGALQLADSVARAPSVDEQMRVQARWAAAVVADASGDPARARADFEALLREYGDRPEFRGTLDDVRRRLGSASK